MPLLLTGVSLAAHVRARAAALPDGRRRYKKCKTLARTKVAAAARLVGVWGGAACQGMGTHG